ncbi:MAG: hypothetical protein GXO88_03035 [Chlorobi bacterium]|nr:hypothetical protein [Chlorobiota bacterium]
MLRGIYIFALISLNLVTTAQAQLPDFIKRLDEGSVQAASFYGKTKFELIDNRIIVFSAINGHTYRFLIDTHSPCLLYDYVLEDLRLDILDKSPTMGESFLTSFLKPIFPKIDTFSIGNVSFFGIGAMLMKSDSTNPLNDMGIDGVIGSNLMKNCIWQFDFSDSTLVLSDEILNFKNIDGAYQIKFHPTPVQASPIITTIIGSDSILTEFDTGNNGFINALSPTISNKISSGKTVALSMKLDITVDRKDADGIETHYYVLLDSMQMGEQMFYTLPIVAYNPSYGQTMGKGSVGVGFLKHFVSTIDWNDKVIYLMPAKLDKPLPHNKDTFGFTYGFKKGSFQVQSILSGSTAETLGLEIGDKILSINGYDVSQLTICKIDEYKNGKLIFSSENDKEITILVMNRGVKKEFKLNSYKLFQLDK